ncbi:MAG: RagB/SusD family nutrient uptake outer membrane protein [bacterium]
MKTHLLTKLLVAATGALLIGACDLDVQDLNNPGLDELLQDNPTAEAVNAACTGLLIGSRRNHAGEFGYVDELGILGREAYNFDTADPRFIGELLGGQLNPGSPFGGGFWAGPYANIRLANVTLKALDKVSTELLSEEKKSGIRGFIHTIMATDLLEVIVTRDTNGAVIDTDRDVSADLGAIVDRTTSYNTIKGLLDNALPELDGGGKTFSFALGRGFDGFDTPPTFRKFNRALKARVAAYTATNATQYMDVLTALNDSFIDDTMMGDFATGVYYVYSTKTGDVTNGLINPNIFVHPSIDAAAQKKGTTLDARFTNKTVEVEDPDDAGSAPGSTEGVMLMSSRKFTIYPDPTSSVSMIRNEELILLKAEALFFTGQTVAANAELNIVRTGAGELDPLPATTDATLFTTELLYERQFSLLFEGHRWIDVRRLNRVNDLPLDDPMFKRNVRFPIPLPECNARPNEAACDLTST